MAASPGSTRSPGTFRGTVSVRPSNGADRSFSSVAFEGSAKQRQVRVLLEDRAGRVWAGAVGGLSMLDRRVSPASFRPVVSSPTATVTSLIESADGSLWIGTLGGLFHRRLSGEVSAEPIALRGGVTHVRALAQDKDGRLWVGHDEGLLVLGPGTGASRPASSAVRELRSCGTGSSRHRRLRLPTGADDACTMILVTGWSTGGFAPSQSDRTDTCASGWCPDRSRQSPD